MGASSPQDNAEPDEHILALVNEYLDRRQAGEEITPERFAAEHHESAEQLRSYLAGLPLIDNACALPGDTTIAAPDAVVADGLPIVQGYELIEEIGRGGMGVVHKALQLSTKRVVALKVMRAGPFASDAAQRRFEREVHLAARLRHSNIVSVLEGGHIADRPYYAMDYVAGVELKRYVSTAKPDLRATLRIFERICEAVDYAHRQGVIHRDLKPANVLVNDEGDPRVLDFGLAKAIDRAEGEEGLTPRVSGPGMVLGTLFYLSPEQAVGAPEEIDLRTDVHALGVMLFEALTGSLPFDTSGSPSDVIEHVLESPPIPPSTLSKQVDAELEALVLKALEKDKTRRYQSAGALAEDIRRYLEGEPLLARQPSSLYVLRKKLRKHRLRVALGAGAVAVSLIALVAGGWWREHWRERELAGARREALHAQRGLESQTPRSQFGPAQALFERHPELPEAALVQARALRARSEGQYVGIDFLEKVLRADPSRWACRALLAEFWQAAGDAERGNALREQAERDAPDTAEAWYLRSFATLDPQHALHCAEEAVKRDPSHTLAWERLAYLRLQTGNSDGALQSADKLIELGEDANEWTLFKGHVLVIQGRLRQAIQVYGQLGTGRYRYQAQVYRRLKDYHKAVECYNSVLEANSERAGAVWDFYQRATPLWILGRTDEALEDYKRVRKLRGRPSYGDARRFVILSEQGDRGEARKVLDAALRDVGDDWLRQILRCLAGQITPEELVADGVARNNPEQLCEACYYAGEVCLLAGNRDQARKWFEQCVQTGVEFDPDTALGTPMNEWELAQWRLESLLSPAP